MPRLPDPPDYEQHQIFDGLYARGKVARAFDVTVARLEEVAAREPVRVEGRRYGYWDLGEIRAVARRFIVVGTPEERDAARELLVELSISHPIK